VRGEEGLAAGAAFHRVERVEQHGGEARPSERRRKPARPHEIGELGPHLVAMAASTVCSTDPPRREDKAQANGTAAALAMRDTALTLGSSSRSMSAVSSHRSVSGSSD
jgi:hypothetical protein